MGFEPAYLETYRSGALDEKVDRALESLESCTLCPRECEVNRLEDEYAFCLSGRDAVVSSHFPHFGEEDCLRGWNGSGTIFFGHCNLRCVFCQNFEISQRESPKKEGTPAEELAALMLQLQERGCHNINFVTPEHVVPQIVEALPIAIERGLRVPLVYNTSGYDSPENLELMEGLVDIYMPDFKYWTPERAETYMKAGDYPETARRAVREMQRQVGDLVVDEDGLAERGLMVRHLVMPDGVDEVEPIARFLVEEVSENVYFNLMDQYDPAGRVDDERTGGQYEEIDRGITDQEFARARRAAERAGIRRFDVREPHPKMRRRII